MPSEIRPSKNEDEYFAKLDAEQVKVLRAKLDAERATTERKAHFMKCPKCGEDLTEQELLNVKVDVCPNCHGMWLDNGEITMIRSGSEGGLNAFFRDFFKGAKG